MTGPKLPPDCSATDRMLIEAAFHDADYRLAVLRELAGSCPELFFPAAAENGVN
jgi:hypothetical protein